MAIKKEMTMEKAKVMMMKKRMRKKRKIRLFLKTLTIKKI